MKISDNTDRSIFTVHGKTVKFADVDRHEQGEAVTSYRRQKRPRQLINELELFMREQLIHHGKYQSDQQNHIDRLQQG